MTARGLLRRSLVLMLAVTLAVAATAISAAAGPSPAVSAQATVSEIPGLPCRFVYSTLPGSSVYTTLAAGSDAVYHVDLLANDTISVTMNSRYQPMDLYLFPPDATTVHDSWYWVGISSQPGTATECITYKARTAGTYYIDVRSLGSKTGYFSLRCTLSRPVVVLPKVSLTAPTHPATAKVGVAFTSIGNLKPRHTAGASSVTIQCYHYENGYYRLVKRVYARNVNYSTYTRYKGSVSLPSKGLWKLKAYAPRDSRHAATYTGYSTTFRVY